MQSLAETSGASLACPKDLSLLSNQETACMSVPFLKGLQPTLIAATVSTQRMRAAETECVSVECTGAQRMLRMETVCVSVQCSAVQRTSRAETVCVSVQCPAAQRMSTAATLSVSVKCSAA